jgi:PIN like domain
LHRLAVERHANHFASETPDEEWLETAGRRGWIVLTHDRRIRYKPNERNAVPRALGRKAILPYIRARQVMS